METIFMQNFGGTNKEYYGIFETGLLFKILDGSYFYKLNEEDKYILTLSV